MKSFRLAYQLIGQDVFAAEFGRRKIYYAIIPLFLFMITILAFDLTCTNDLGKEIYIIQACILISLVHVIVKYYCLKDLHALRPIVAFFENIYRKNSLPTDVYYGICRRYAHFTELMFRSVAAMYIGIIVITALVALAESFSTMTPSFHVYFPFVREYSVVQLLVMDMLMGITGLATVIVMPASDLLFYLVVANFTMIPLIIVAQMNALSMRLQQRRANVGEIKRRWMHYIVIHQEYIR